MSRRESDLEDLLREATALVERAELKIADYDEPIVVGFRRDGSASVFFGPDPVYQFNSAGELRRAYVSGLLYKAERGSLCALRRERNETEVALVRSNLPPDETAALLMALRGCANCGRRSRILTRMPKLLRPCMAFRRRPSPIC
jgi:hypothetical protein